MQLFELHELHPLVAFTIVILAIVAYRFIKPDKTFDLHFLVPLAGIIKDKDEANTMVNVRITMMVLVSLIVLVSSIYTILTGTYSDGTQKWAYGSIGTILGFWLKK